MSHMLKSKTILSFGLRRHAIRRNRYLEFPHIGVIRRVEDADVRGESDDNQTLDVQTLQEYFKRRGKETRVHRLQDKEVLFGGFEKFDNLPAAVSFLQTIFNLLVKVRTPLAEIVVA